MDTRLLSASTTSVARRLLNAAQRPLGDLSAVMASPPTITDPATDGANSTIQTGQAYNAGMFSVSDPARVTPLGGPIALLSSTFGYRIQTMTKTAGTRMQGHGAGVAFYTDADTVDIAVRCNGARWIAYVTDPDGVRRRIQATDRAQAFANLNYEKLAFGSTAGGGRLVEVYNGQGGNFGGINVPTGYSIWPANFAHQPKIACLWDSFGEGSMNDTTLNLKLAVMDWFAGVFGCNNPHINALASTGLVATATGTALTFGQRIAAGDMDYTRIGHQDLIFAPGSVNDNITAVGGLDVPAGDATVQQAYQDCITALMVAQPRAIIIGAPQEHNNSAAAAATRVAAYKAGFLAAANGSARMIWLEGSLFEKVADTGVIGADSLHPGAVFGARHIGERLGRQSLAAIGQLA